MDNFHTFYHTKTAGQGKYNLSQILIDDEIEICNVIKRVFQKRNFEVLYSPEGKDGLGLFYSEKPEISILDLNLSDISGFEVLKTIKIILLRVMWL